MPGVLLMMLHLTQELEPPANPARFILHQLWHFISRFGVLLQGQFKPSSRDRQDRLWLLRQPFAFQTLDCGKNCLLIKTDLASDLARDKPREITA